MTTAVDAREVRKVQVKPEVRTLRLDRGSVRVVEPAEGEAADDFVRIDMSFCSDAPVRQYWWGVGMVEEVLEHTDAAIRLDRARNFCPVRATSHYGEIVGVVEPDSFRIEGGKLRGRIKFSRNSEMAKTVAGDLLDEVLGNVSIQYEVHRAVLERPGTDEELPLYRAVEWELFHVAIVGEAADVTVGAGRSKDADPQLREIPVEIPPAMEGAQRRAGEENVMVPEIVDITPEARAGIVKDAQTAERNRQKEIRAIAERFASVDAIQKLATKALEEGTPADDFRRAAFDAIPTGQATRVSDDSPAELGVSQRDLENYSLARAINAAAEKNWAGAGLEREMSDAVAKRLGKPARGFYVPDDLLRSPKFIEKMGERTVVATGTGGSGLLATEHMAGSFIEFLYKQAQVLAAGATVMDGLVGNVAIPKRTGTATIGWVTAEGNDGTEDTTTAFSTVTMSPKLVTGWVPVTRSMLLQGNPAIDMLIREDLVRQVGLAIDLAALTGSGSSGVPRGIQNLSGVNSVAIGTNGGAPTWDLLTRMEQEVAADDADSDRSLYLVNAKTRGALKRALIGVSAETVWSRFDAANPLNNRRALVTNQLPSNLTKGTSVNVCSLAIYGDFSNLFVGFWGAMDLMVDPITLAKSGGVRLHVYRDADIAARYVESFCICADITTA